LTRLFIGNSVDFENQAILPFHQGSTVVACLGWIEKSTTTKTIIANAQDIRRTFRSAWALEMARSECQALRWVLSRCDRLVAAVRPGGEILASSPAFADLLKSIQVGPRHYFHASDPELPPPLTEGIAKAPAGQVKLSKNCTARLDPIVATSDSWQPLIGIELFLEKAPPSHLPPPLSRLTRVEREIYDLIKTGATNQEIADLRGTAFTTAKNQVSAILAKMGVSRRHHLLIHEAGTITPLSQLHKPGMNGVVSSTR
jgi:DNA-binding NarL/FixJ family response regulator